MKPDDNKSNEVARFLENLVSFLADEHRDPQEVVEHLKSQGINPDQALRRFHDLLSQHAPTWQEKAARERRAALEAPPSGPVAHHTRDEVTQQIRDLIAGMTKLGAPVVAGAYHQRFQEATDTDLESLLQDLRTQYEQLKNSKEKPK